jgi:hypothetical protein
MTMNAVVQFQPQANAVAVPSFTMSDMERIATAIAKGGMFGSKDPYAVLTLCMVAQAEGKHPAIIARDFHIIQGRPAYKSERLLADFITRKGRSSVSELEEPERLLSGATTTMSAKEDS